MPEMGLGEKASALYKTKGAVGSAPEAQNQRPDS